jgi:hypothetical protein
MNYAQIHKDMQGLGTAFGLLNNQVAMLRLRDVALENVLTGGRFALVRVALTLLIRGPKAVGVLIEREHKRLIREFEDQLTKMRVEQAEKAKQEEESPANRLILPGRGLEVVEAGGQG